MRMSSGPAAATESASATTWAGSRRSIPTMVSRSSHCALSGIAAKRAVAGQIGAGVPLGAVERRARRAELVVEGVDVGVRLLADVARPWTQQRARGRAGRGSD